MPLNRRSFLGASIAAAGLAQTPISLALSGSSALKFDDYRKLDALALAQGIRQGEFTAAEVLETAIVAAQRINPTINAIVEPLYDYARNQLEQGLPQGPFAGVPFLLKDLGLMLEGTHTTEGSRFFKDQVAAYSDTMVQRYLDAGFLMMGKSASPEFGGTATTESILFGDTRNPWDLSKTTGGSSGGSAAAVAAGILPLANATDGGGSIRIPASCCGLFGMKPSRARTPRGPKTIHEIMSVTHCVSRSVRDSAALLDATAGPELGAAGGPPAPATAFLAASKMAPKKLRIGLVTTPVSRTPVHANCIDAVMHTAKLCESLGHVVEPVELGISPATFFGATGDIMAAGTVAKVKAREHVLGRRVTENDLEPLTWLRYQAALNNTAADYVKAVQAVHQIGRDMSILHQTYDVLLSPTLANPPLDLGKLALTRMDKGYEMDVVSYSAFTMLFNATGAPAMSVPLYWNAAGLPIGTMFAADFGNEALLYSLAGQLEQAQPWFDRVPLV